MKSLLQLYLLVYEVLHLGRCTMKQAGSTAHALEDVSEGCLEGWGADSAART